MSDPAGEGDPTSANPGAWVEHIRGAPPEVIADALIVKVHEVVDAQPPGEATAKLRRSVELVFEPREVRDAYRQECLAALLQQGLTDGIERWLQTVGDEPGEPLGGVSEADFTNTDTRDLWTRWLDSRPKPEQSPAEAGEILDELKDELENAERGVYLGTRADDQPWSRDDTFASLRQIDAIRARLQQPVSDSRLLNQYRVSIYRLRNVLLEGVSAPEDGHYVASHLLEIAEETRDYKAFLTASEKFQAAIAAGYETGRPGGEEVIIRIATWFMNHGVPPSLDTRPLTIALDALAQYDLTASPLSAALTLARLARALKGIK